MTDKLTTAEVRRAATTNLDLPLTLFKKLESGFDAWLEGVKAEARAEGNSEGRAAERIELWSVMQSGKNQETPVKPATAAKKAPESTVKPSPLVTSNASDEKAAPVRPIKRKRIRPKKNKQAITEAAVTKNPSE